MSDLLNQKIERWIENNLHLLASHNHLSIHIDTLLGEGINQSEIISTSLEVFTLLVGQTEKQKISARPGLVIPLLSDSYQLEAVVPQNLEEIENQLNDEPPSLYLLDCKVLKYLAIYEEYKCPLSLELFKDIREGTYIYYREFRDATAIKNEWEFSRCVYVEYYAADYRLN